MPRKLLSARAYAKERGCTEGAVRRAIREGRLSRSVHYRQRGSRRTTQIDPKLADQEWDASTKARAGEPFVEPVARDAEGVESLANERRLLVHWQRRRAELDYRERSKELAELEQCRSETWRLARSLRDAILAVPDRVADLFAAETNPIEIERILDLELRHALAPTEGLDGGGDDAPRGEAPDAE